jgi:hypothetical protein
LNLEYTANNNFLKWKYCGCFDEKIKKIITSEVLLQGAKYAMNVGQDSKAEDMLAKAKDICESNCKDC